MRPKPLEYNNEFITETVVLLYSLFRDAYNSRRLRFWFSLGCKTKKLISHHDIYNNVNFGLRKINRKKLLCSVIDSCVYKRKHAMKKKNRFQFGKSSTPGLGIATADRGTCEDILSFLRVVNFLKKNEETVRLKGDGSEVSLINIYIKKITSHKQYKSTEHVSPRGRNV